MAAHLAYYEVLGLDAPPADRKAVKRAYSKMLKVTRPEDDPDGFMRLRDAHDIALNIVAREAENAAWEAEQALYKAKAAEPAANRNTAPNTDAEGSPESGLTYEDMLSEEAPVSDTGYAIGPTPSLDAPPNPPGQAAEPDTTYSIGPTPSFDAPVTFTEPEEPKAPPLIDDINALMDKPKNYNDREKWNILFRKARKLDIDDYVDFEQLLLEKILHFHGYYYDENPLFNTPEKMVQKLTPSIAASLFKTMSWDQVNKQGFYRGQQVEWLERRMQMRKRRPDSVPVPETNSGNSVSIWWILFGLFIAAKIVQFVVNA